MTFTAINIRFKTNKLRVNSDAKVIVKLNVKFFYTAREFRKVLKIV